VPVYGAAVDDDDDDDDVKDDGVKGAVSVTEVLDEACDECAEFWFVVAEPDGPSPMVGFGWTSVGVDASIVGLAVGCEVEVAEGCGVVEEGPLVDLVGEGVGIEVVQVSCMEVHPLSQTWQPTVPTQLSWVPEAQGRHTP